uniref:ATP-grasp domain-containing protein n=1 Tax=Eiseniibacteriota bacterium TaxID=2212470 RepID=A0A832HZQ2_UNCEI
MHATASPAEAALAVKPGPETLVPLLRPRSVAVIGASRDVQTIGGALFKNILTRGFNGPVYPVNPKSPFIQSVAAYPSIEAVPGAVDLAFVVVPAAQALEAVEACGRKGVRAVVVITAGFRETGEKGAALERRLLEVVRGYGMRMVGPNCLGLINTAADVRLNGHFALAWPPPGPMAFSSQSGALGVAILEYATQLNVGISHFVSVGNKADVSGNDLLEFWEQDDATRIILLYLESFGNPGKFIQIARRVGRVKPIIAVKSGRTGAGRRAASSHTGSIAGADAAVDALCAQSGVIRTDTIEELFDVAMLLANQPVPRGSRVAILTNAGGPAIMASDALESLGLEVPELAEATQQELRSFLPPEAATRNPVDMIASATPANFERATVALLADPNVDALLVLFVPPLVTRPEEVSHAVARGMSAARRAAERAGDPAKPVLSCFMGVHGVHLSLGGVQEGQIPSYVFPESAAIALARAVGYGRWLHAAPGVLEALPADREAAARVVAAAAARGGGWLEPAEVAALLTAYGLAQPEVRFAATPEAAVAAADAIGWPVVLKLDSATITHKSDVGGVVLDVRDADEVHQAWARIRGRLEAMGRADEMRGVTVQPLVRDGVETIIGMTRDPKFGPLVMFGLGGIHVEVLKDVAFRIAPLTDRDAREMVRAVRAFPLLEGHRGAPPADLAALEEALRRVSQLAGDHPAIAELDLNPVRALARGRGVLVIDARVRVAD